MLRLTDELIERTCRDLLARQRRVTVRAVRAQLRMAYGSGGRTERVARLLRRVENGSDPVPSPAVEELGTLLARLRQAEAQAARSEALERSHQDYWAARYAEKVAALERQQELSSATGPRITHQQYLELHRRIAELSRRLAQYEDVDRADRSSDPLRD